MSKHTPGPWTVIYCNRDLPPHVTAKLRFKPVDVMIGDRRLRISENDSGDADARLIAAAPELLEAARTFQEYCEAIDDGDDVAAMHFFAIAQQQFKAVIAKAEGRT